MVWVKDKEPHLVMTFLLPEPQASYDESQGAYTYILWSCFLGSYQYLIMRAYPTDLVQSFFPVALEIERKVLCVSVHAGLGRPCLSSSPGDCTRASHSSSEEYPLDLFILFVLRQGLRLALNSLCRPGKP